MARKTTSKAVTVATRDAAGIMSRFEAVEQNARTIHEQSVGGKMARALLSNGRLSAVISDGRSTIEICDGKVAVSVQSSDETE